MSNQAVKSQHAAGVSKVGNVVDSGATPINGSLALIARGKVKFVAGQAVGEAKHLFRIEPTRGASAVVGRGVEAVVVDD